MHALKLTGKFPNVSCATSNTLDYGLLLRHSHSLQFIAHSDADWVGNHDDCTSIYAYVLFLGENPISWCSKKQRIVARSYTEAKYLFVASVAAEIAWVMLVQCQMDLGPSSFHRVRRTSSSHKMMYGQVV